MTAKEYLMQYRDCMNRIRAIESHLQELRAIREQLRTEDGHSIALGKAVANLVDTETQCENEVTHLLQTETEVVCTIERVKEPYRTVLYERYINGKTWEQIAVQMNYCFRHTTKLHGTALKLVKDVLECPI